ncbi:hypothetical protein RAJCM14343_2735 [Rhodococcus aetherivorans]|uniref:Terminase n=2 Tax=Rhodococcus aetherivorans TaxID=191292 RepID=A0ABQ0YLN4_9NOCA|nr:hypothetical protein RAJCM14343_2735 [Rhodococcus aetherivorans]
MAAAIVAEMAEEGLVPDAKEQALLDAAAQVVDRIDALEKIVARDGELLTSSTGTIRVHPAVAEHRQLAATLPKVLSGIVLGNTATAKDPVKQRAANRRWQLHNDRKAANG